MPRQIHCPDREWETPVSNENILSPVIHHPGKVGAGLSLASLPVHFLVPATASHELAAVLLAMVAGIYVGFAVQDGRATALRTEGLVALAFVAAALIGLWVTVWTVPAAYALHGLWDLAHHRRITTAMPAWYVPFCAVYDWIFVAGLIVAWLPR